MCCVTRDILFEHDERSNIIEHHRTVLSVIADCNRNPKSNLSLLVAPIISTIQPHTSYRSSVLVFCGAFMSLGSYWLSFSTLVSLSTASRRNFTSAACRAQSIDMLKDFPIGLGTYQISPEQIPASISSAIQLGYRRIDCAPVYFNEDKIGDVLQQELANSNLERKDLFIVSKLASPFHRKEHVKIGLQKTLQDLRLDYLDLFLIHWPQAFTYVPIDMTQRGYSDEEIDESEGGRRIDPNVSIHETWKAMEDLVEEGLVRSIGVSNFPVSLLHELMTQSKIPPAVNQVELHPYLQQPKLLDYCNKRGVHLQAYSPLGTPGYKEDGEPDVLNDPVLVEIAKKHDITVAQLCLTWALQRGTTVVAKSVSPKRQEENFASTTRDPKIVLTEEEIKQIEALDRGYRFFRPEDWWGSMAIAVFD